MRHHHWIFRAMVGLAVCHTSACDGYIGDQVEGLLDDVTFRVVDAPSGKQLVWFTTADIIKRAQIDVYLNESATTEEKDAANLAMIVQALEVRDWRRKNLLDDHGRGNIDDAQLRAGLVGLDASIAFLSMLNSLGIAQLQELIVTVHPLPPKLVLDGITARVGSTDAACGSATDGTLHAGHVDGRVLVGEVCSQGLSMDTVVHDWMHALFDHLVARKHPGTTGGFGTGMESRVIEEALADMYAREAARVLVVGCLPCESTVGAMAADPTRPCAGGAGCGTDELCVAIQGCDQCCTPPRRLIDDGRTYGTPASWSPAASATCPEPWCSTLRRAVILRRAWGLLQNGGAHRGLTIPQYGRVEKEGGPVLEDTVPRLFWRALQGAPVDLSFAWLTTAVGAAADPRWKDAVRLAFCAVGLPEQDVACHDPDGDDHVSLTDNCDRWNPDQLDVDKDGIGDSCQGERDADGDGIPNAQDRCPELATTAKDNEDMDNDGIGDGCDDDLDGDTFPQVATATRRADNCPRDPNKDQKDRDRDKIGDVCDDDIDGDGVLNLGDNCPVDENAAQCDFDRDGIGDACDDDSDSDCIPDAADDCPFFAGCANPPPSLCQGCGIGPRINLGNLKAIGACLGKRRVTGFDVCQGLDAMSGRKQIADRLLAECRAAANAARGECARCPPRTTPPPCNHR